MVQAILLAAVSLIVVIFYVEYIRKTDSIENWVSEISLKVSELYDNAFPPTTEPPRREVDTRTYNKIRDLMDDLNEGRTTPYMAFEELAVWKDENFDKAISILTESKCKEQMACLYYWGEIETENKEEQE